MSQTAQSECRRRSASWTARTGSTLGRILGRGTVGTAEEGPDGKMTATIRIPEDELVYEPGVLVLPHGGELELTIINDDKNTHCAVLPSNGDTQFIWLVNHSKGTATLHLDGPGYYWYGSRTGNDEGRGLTGAIVVQGDAPPEASSTARPSRARRSTARLTSSCKGAAEWQPSTSTQGTPSTPSP